MKRLQHIIHPGKKTPTDKKRFFSPPLSLLTGLCCLLFFVSCKKDPPISGSSGEYTIVPGNINLNKEDAVPLQLYVLKGRDTLPPAGIVWRSGNEQILSFSGAGLLVPVWAGEAEIIASSTQGKELARRSVTVTDNYVYKLRLVLKDKGTHENLSLSNPAGFLSARAIARRQRQNIAVTNEDIPIANQYLNQISQLGGIIVAKSKWLKSVSVHVDDPALLHKYRALPFVESVKVVWRKKRSAYQKPSTQWTFPGSNAPQAPTVSIADDPSVYGVAFDNLKLNKGNRLHQMGFKGRNIQIAVIDAGFKNINQNTTLGNLHITGAKSFIYEQPNPYSIDEHGTAVLSIMGGARPGQYVGTAPEASFLLLTSEDDTDEFPIEEDYYVSALEYADSSGADIVNTSLGYDEYDLPGGNNTFEMLDGKTAFASRGVTAAFSKGILIVVSAGNSGRYVGSPADSPHALAVGMTFSNGSIVSISSSGLTADGRIKPDIVAMGGSSYVILSSGSLGGGTGTSYASPAISGMAACLWQAFPQLTNGQLADIIKRSADRYPNPVLPYGNGLPDMEKAYTLAQGN